MSDFSKTLDKFAATPWKAGLMVLGVSFLAATVCSTVAANFFFPADGRVPQGVKLSSNFNVPNPTSTLNQASIDMIIKRNLFNSEGSAEDAKPEDQGNQPQTAEAVKSDLPVKLVGTIYGGDPFSGIALVENNSKRTINSFMVGDNLIKEAVVKEIHKERIIIDRSGRLEFIEVVKEALSRNKRKKKAATVTAGGAVAPIATEPPPSTFKEEGFERKEKEISMTQAYRNKLLTTDFTKVLQDLKATPNMVDGELKGFLLTRIRKDSIWEKAGFQNDDIAEEINGVPLTDTAQAIRLLQSLRNESEIEVRVNRGGTPTKFTLQIQ